jgi:hypothetical protein
MDAEMWYYRLEGGRWVPVDIERVVGTSCAIWRVDGTVEWVQDSVLRTREELVLFGSWIEPEEEEGD